MRRAQEQRAHFTPAPSTRGATKNLLRGNVRQRKWHDDTHHTCPALSVATRSARIVMRQYKDFKELSEAEVGTWLTARGLGAHAAAFRRGGVDGRVLLALTEERLKGDLGLSVLQAKRLRRSVDLEITAPAEREEKARPRRRTRSLPASLSAFRRRHRPSPEAARAATARLAADNARGPSRKRGTPPRRPDANAPTLRRRPAAAAEAQEVCAREVEMTPRPRPPPPAPSPPRAPEGAPAATAGTAAGAEEREARAPHRARRSAAADDAGARRAYFSPTLD